jgi:hypothetical protein
VNGKSEHKYPEAAPIGAKLRKATVSTMLMADGPDARE